MGKVRQIASHGSLRRQIVALDRLGQGRVHPERIARDRYLRRFVRRGMVTPEQLQEAITGCLAAPSRFTWMAKVDPAVLARADCVFLAEFGIFPLNDADFQLNGRYHLICRSLEHDWHYYDQQLKELDWGRDGTPYARLGGNVTVQEETLRVEQRVGNLWAFAAVLLAGLAGGPVVGNILSRQLSGNRGTVLAIVAILWGVAFGGLLVLTIPRRVRRVDVVRRCGRCGQEQEPQQATIGCRACGASFADR
jgi:hypothetical protein